MFLRPLPRRLKLGPEARKKAAQSLRKAMQGALLWTAVDLAVAASGGALNPLVVSPLVRLVDRRIQIARGTLPPEQWSASVINYALDHTSGFGNKAVIGAAGSFMPQGMFAPAKQWIAATVSTAKWQAQKV